MRLVGKILDRAMVALEDAWSSILKLKFKLEESEMNPQLVQIVPARSPAAMRLARPRFCVQQPAARP